MEKIRNGKSGEITAEVFETWFPEEPELLLMDFLHSGKEDVFLVIKLNETDIGITHITRKYAQTLLDEFKVLRGK
jgi:hypothetical protein